MNGMWNRIGGWLQRAGGKRPVVLLLTAALLVHIGAALVAFRLPEGVDENEFRRWANHAVDKGIHLAYSSPEVHYSYLPFYLYLCKAVGLAYRYSGLSSQFGPNSRVLSGLFKGAMILLNLLIGWLIYRMVNRFYGEPKSALWAAAAYLFNPAIAVATDVFGYQDALHTALVFLSVFCLCSNWYGWAAVWAMLGFLTKPQAAIFLPLIGVYLILHAGLRSTAKSIGIAVVTGLVVLSPFVAYGEIAGVIRMYFDVPRVHQWLTGYAHNIWFVFSPGIHSDRTPLLLGMNGLTIGLLLLTAFSLWILYRLIQCPSLTMLIHLCAFQGFIFFMVTTEIHENHLYAMFPFLTVAATTSRSLRHLWTALTITFTLDLVLTTWVLNVGRPVMLGPVRLSVINALANVAVLGYWVYILFMQKLPDRRYSKHEPSSQFLPMREVE